MSVQSAEWFLLVFSLASRELVMLQDASYRLNLDLNNTRQGCVPVDFEALSRNTFGDADLRVEILRLFADQLCVSRRSFAGQFTNTDWRFATHTLKGAAAAVGAQQFASLAHEWENQGPPFDCAAAKSLLAAFDEAEANFRTSVRNTEGIEL